VSVSISFFNLAIIFCLSLLCLVIDSQPSQSRKEQRIMALCDVVSLTIKLQIGLYADLDV
jgi:hypothetical protein